MWTEAGPVWSEAGERAKDKVRRAHLEEGVKELEQRYDAILLRAWALRPNSLALDPNVDTYWLWFWAGYWTSIVFHCKVITASVSEDFGNFMQVKHSALCLAYRISYNTTRTSIAVTFFCFYWLCVALWEHQHKWAYNILFQEWLDGTNLVGSCGSS